MPINDFKLFDYTFRSRKEMTAEDMEELQNLIFNIESQQLMHKDIFAYAFPLESDGNGSYGVYGFMAYPNPGMPWAKDRKNVIAAAYPASPNFIPYMTVLSEHIPVGSDNYMLDLLCGLRGQHEYEPPKTADFWSISVSNKFGNPRYAVVFNESKFVRNMSIGGLDNVVEYVSFDRPAFLKKLIKDKTGEDAPVGYGKEYSFGCAGIYLTTHDQLESILGLPRMNGFTVSLPLSRRSPILRELVKECSPRLVEAVKEAKKSGSLVNLKDWTEDLELYPDESASFLLACEIS